MKFGHYTSCFLLLLFTACGTKETNTTSTDASKAVVNTDTVASAEVSSSDDTELTPKGDEIREMGVLKQVEDSGYPMAYLVIEFPERKTSEYFDINLEEVKSYNINQLRDGIGKYVSFLYTSELKNTLLDLRVKGKSIVSEEKIELSPETHKIVGVLSGADEVTPGDLPGNVTITTKDNTAFTFEFFVTQEMVEVNGKQVVGYYEERGQNKIATIKFAR